jgi:hypothetical protein
LAGVIGLVGLLVWRVPPLLYKDVPDLNQRAAAEASTRTGLIAGLVGLAALGGLVVTARTYRLTQQGQITDRYTKRSSSSVPRSLKFVSEASTRWNASLWTPSVTIQLSSKCSAPLHGSALPFAPTNTSQPPVNPSRNQRSMSKPRSPSSAGFLVGTV